MSKAPKETCGLTHLRAENDWAKKEEEKGGETCGVTCSVGEDDGIRDEGYNLDDDVIYE